MVYSSRNTLEDSIRKLLMFYKVEGEALENTPSRYFEALKEALSGYDHTLDELATSFEHDGLDAMVICRNIQFYSLCEHHVFPWWGVAHIGYIPNGRVLGLSKMPRVVEAFSRRFQLQERMTKQIADWMETSLKPLGVGVIVEGVHLCVRMRGIRSQEAEMVTSEMRGVFRKEPEARQEFMDMVRKNGK